MAAYRTKFFDPDYRRDPKTNRFCAICQRDLKEGQSHRMMMFELDTMNAVHADDWGVAASDIESRRHALNPVCIEPIGMDCAKRLGFDWSVAP